MGEYTYVCQAEHAGTLPSTLRHVQTTLSKHLKACTYKYVVFIYTIHKNLEKKFYKKVLV